MTFGYASIKEDAENKLVEFFGNEAKLRFEKITLTKEIADPIEKKVKQRFFSAYVYLWTIAYKESLIGYALLDNVKGKSMPITFLVIYDLKPSVVHTEIIKYREPIGGEVSQKSWLKQFIGKTLESKYNDIDGISGATISVESVKKGIQKLSLLLEILNEKY